MTQQIKNIDNLEEVTPIQEDRDKSNNDAAMCVVATAATSIPSHTAETNSPLNVSHDDGHELQLGGVTTTTTKSISSNSLVGEPDEAQKEQEALKDFEQIKIQIQQQLKEKSSDDDNFFHSSKLQEMIHRETVRHLELAWIAQRQLAILSSDDCKDVNILFE